MTSPQPSFQEVSAAAAAYPGARECLRTRRLDAGSARSVPTELDLNGSSAPSVAYVSLTAARRTSAQNRRHADQVSSVTRTPRLRLRVMVGLFETTTPVLGLQFGRSLASTLCHAAHSIGVASEGAHP